MEAKKIWALLQGKKPWLLVILGILGMVLILISSFIPSGEEKTVLPTDNPAAEIETRLEALISQIDGAGHTKVMVSLSDSGSTQYLSEGTETEEWSEGLMQRKEQSESYVTAGGGAVAVAELAPSVEGIAVVCEGGGLASVQNDIYEVLNALYGLSSARISVEQMH